MNGSPAAWVPSAMRWPRTGPVVDWCHLGDLRFTDPFFEQTIGRAMKHPFNLLFGHNTPLATIAADADKSPELKLSGFIFHMSRCGSTVVSQMLAALPANLVLSEPAPIDQILRIPDRYPNVPQDEVARCLRGMLVALGRRRCAPERDVFIKLDAWHILRWRLIRRAFPDVPWIFVYRDPLEVLASLAQSRPSQMFGSTNPALLGSDAATLSAMTFDAYSALVLACYCRAAIEHHRDGGMLVAYRELPDAACGKVLEHFGLRYGEAEMAAMRAAAQFDAKNPKKHFQPDGEAKRREASEEQRRLAQSQLAPLYAQLETLRLGLARR
jgi:hypothetical protein